MGGIELVISYSGGDGNDVVLRANSAALIGDVNLDGAVNLLDVEPFVDLISSGGFQAEADTNADGVVNLLDIDPVHRIVSWVAFKAIASLKTGMMNVRMRTKFLLDCRR